MQNNRIYIGTSLALTLAVKAFIRINENNWRRNHV